MVHARCASDHSVSIGIAIMSRSVHIRSSGALGAEGLGMSTLMPERVTPQQEERIRELRAENWFLDNPHNEVNEAVDDLFLLLDEARAELETERMRNVA